jgi:alpha-tubulin suppressor-like RCC1 family protein
MGEHHCVVLTSGGDLLAWGQNRFGELCTGDINDRAAPSLVGPLAALRAGDQMCEVAAGAQRTALLTRGGDLITAGRWSGGGGFESVNWVPQLLPALAGIKLAEMALGKAHAVARADDGSVYSFGEFSAACGHEGEGGFEYLG